VSSYNSRNVRRRERYREVSEHPERLGIPKCGRPRRVDLDPVKLNNNKKRRHARAQAQLGKICINHYAVLSLFANTPQAKESFPELTQQINTQKVLAHAGRGAINLSKHLGNSVKRFHVNFLVTEMNKNDLQEFSKLSGFPIGYLRKAKNMAHDVPLPLGLTASQSRAPNRAPSTCYELLKKACVDFFVEHTAIHSGSRSERRQLSMDVHTLYFHFYADFPGYCRDLAQLWPVEIAKLRNNPPVRLSRIERSIVLSITVSEQPGFNEKQEFKERYEYIKNQYLKTLIEQRLCRKFGITR